MLRSVISRPRWRCLAPSCNAFRQRATEQHVTRSRVVSLYEWNKHQRVVGDGEVLSRQKVALSTSVIEDDISEITRDSKSNEEALIEDILRGNNDKLKAEVQRLTHLRNVGVFAHVDAGKTTVTERMLALAGVVHSPGSVDSGSTVTDFLPAERERGITIQSAAISFDWGWHNAPQGDDYEALDAVQVHLIDTPGHVDFTVEVNRSVAVLDGAVLVIDAVAGVQAQTETVWNAMAAAPHSTATNTHKHTSHEPLPCLAVVNKMDKEGSQFTLAVESIRNRLPGANPIPIQLPLFQNQQTVTDAHQNISVVPLDDTTTASAAGQFLGVVDLIHMRTVIWDDPQNSSQSSSHDVLPPKLQNLLDATHQPINPTCPITQAALLARSELIAALADVDPIIEHYFLQDQEHDISNAQLRLALRRATLSRKALPVMASAALKGKGVEPILDAVADLLPSPMDRSPPLLVPASQAASGASLTHKQKLKPHNEPRHNIQLGHPLHPSLLAMAFKIIHIKGRGGSGDGRIVFARVYSGKLRARDTVRCISPTMEDIDDSDDTPATPSATASRPSNNQPRTEKIGAMLELAGGKFDNLPDGVCFSGDVCALVGLKSVVTGDTILQASSSSAAHTRKNDKHQVAKKNKQNTKATQESTSLPNLHYTGLDSNNGFDQPDVCFAGIASPRPVLTVRLEAASSQDQQKLSSALANLAVEDPSLHVKDTKSATLVSGMGELQMEVTMDRLKREFGLHVRMGKPAVSYRATLLRRIETMEEAHESRGSQPKPGFFRFDRSIGGTRLQGAVHLILEPFLPPDRYESGNQRLAAEAPSIITVVEPIVELGPKASQFFQLDETFAEVDDNSSRQEGRQLLQRQLAKDSPAFASLLAGIKGALRRGSPSHFGPYPLCNVKCTIVDVEAEGGLPALEAMPGSIRATAANAIMALLSNDSIMDDGSASNSVTALEPNMKVEVTIPNHMVGAVVSDLSARRGTIGDVYVDDENTNGQQNKSLVRAFVPLSEILGYATSLRSLTGGEGTFTAEYVGHGSADARSKEKIRNPGV